ncbi:O-antigen ligase [Nitrosospira sp. Nl5]|uniref:O-antigen ligase family protein n=1 Tax=Nitrosospira sp. Nl5 TaxID=200120 RepID=UPI00089226F2|nr:O-antigen ligase family protein [Nitrosospira sp. Nl5]SCY25367.1 O-antigen ligase [Nitrosospira sp. Nl5]
MRDALAKSALLFFGIALWSKGLSLYAYYLLTLAWILDGGLGRYRETIKEPFILAMLILCVIVALGIFWSDHPKLGVKVWKKYSALLIFIPYLSLLDKGRLPWAMSGLFIGYFGILLAGVYQWRAVGSQGIRALDITYVDFSATLGIGVILALYLAGKRDNKKARALLWVLAASLLFIQFNQNARGLLLSTLVSSGLLVFLLHKKRIRTLLAITASLIVAIAVFAYSSASFQQRLAQAQSDIELSTQGRYDTSLGYRLAIWDIGLYGIAERPLFGHGTGAAAPYFDKTVETYKDGRYKDLPRFLRTYHYHNDWIEIGMHVGMLGLLAYAFLLWSWFQTLKIYKLPILGAAFMCFILLFGMTDVLVILRQNLYLLLAITAVAISWQRAHRADHSTKKEFLRKFDEQ